MNPAVKRGSVALSTTRNRFTVSTPTGDGQKTTTASPTRLASEALGLERTSERTANFNSSTWQLSIPNPKKPLQPCWESHLNSQNRSNITPCSSLSDTSRSPGKKKQKLGSIVQRDRISTFSWPNDPIQPRQGQNHDFSATKTSQPPQDSISVRTRNKQVSDAISDHDSSPTRSLGSSGLNETFRSPSSGSDPILGNMKNASETTPENTLQKESTSSSDAFRAMELTSVIPLPCRGSIPSSEHTEASMTSKDIVHSRRKSRGILLEEEQQSQTYLAVVWQSGKLAVAYYDADLCQIFMMPDIQENDEFLLFHKDQIQPKCIVIGSKQDDRLIKTIQIPDNASEDGLSLDKDSYLQVLPSIDFSAELCKRRILAVDLPTIPDHFTESDRTLYMSSLVPFENIHMVQAVGGLLKFLDKKRIGIELESTSCRIPILAFNIFTMQDMMLIDENTYGALQIFHRESHPSVYKAGFSNAAKEGLSLFGIMNRCRSQIGSKMLRLWFQRPTRDLEVLKQRQDAIAFFCCARNFEVTSTLMECQKNIKNISRILGRMTQSEASLSEWQALYKTVYNAIHIGDICRAQTSNVVLLRKIGAKFTDDLHRIGSLISKIVDFEESAAEGRFVVKVGVDPELDQKKRTYNGLPDFLTRVARDELNKLSNDITECNIQYLPQLGYLLAVPETEELRARNNYKIETLEFMFMSNKMLHYKSESTKELDLILGDTHSEIADHEIGIMHRLQNTILEHSAVLVDVMRLAAELDCLLALAAASKEGNYVRPELLTDKCIRIKGGRHPLQELCVPSFVPNDTFSDSRDGFMKILTGPNASGKSVYLKQVALIVFLAHIGSFVPAEEAHIGLTDAIYTRVRTQESVSVGLSTFMIDLNQVSAATRSAASNSLILLDEFGKGTETEDGLALLCSCLKFWLKKNEGCPHVFVSTHFHSLVSRHLLPDSPLLKYQTMEVLRDDEGELVFLYQLVEGTTQTSYACHVATVAGIPKEIVSRGSEVSELIRTNRPIGRIDSPCNERQFERCKDVVNKFLELDLENDDLQVFLHDVVLPACQVLK